MISWQDYHRKQEVVPLGEDYVAFRAYGNPSRECLICLHGIST